MTTRSLNKALSQVKQALDTKPSAQFKYVSLSFPDGAFCIWFDHSRHRGKLGGGAAAVCPFVRPSVTLCGGRPTAMMGGDDNITQNVDRNERERERGTKMREEAECKQAEVRHGPFAVPLIVGLNFPMDMNMFKTLVAFLHFPTLPYLMGYITKFYEPIHHLAEVFFLL